MCWFLPLEAKYVINDGQHRVAGISEALRSDPTLASDTISVVVLPDAGLERSQQIFSDLNRDRPQGHPSRWTFSMTIGIR